MLCTIIIFSFTHYVNGCCHSVCLGSERCWWSYRMLPKLLFLSESGHFLSDRNLMTFLSLIWWHLKNGLLVRCATCSSKLLSTFVQDIIRVLIVQHFSWFSQSPWSCLTSYKAWNLSNEINQDTLCQFFTENWFSFFLWITWHKSSLKNFPGFCVPPILKSHLTDLMKPRGNSSLFLLLILSVQSRAFCSIFSLWFLVFVFLVLSSKNCCKLARGAGAKKKIE